MALLITLMLGLFFVVGILVVRFSKDAHTIERYSISIALGAMIGIGLLDILPEMIETAAGNVYLPIVGVIVGFFALVGLDKFIPEHEEETSHDYSDENMVHIGMISSIAIILHNIIEGMAVYSLASTQISDGLMLMVGIGLHNIPMGMFIYSTLHSKKGAKKNIFLTATVLSTFVGGIIMVLLKSYMMIWVDIMLYGVALGMIIYIVVLELIPYIRKNHFNAQSKLCALFGFAVVLVSVFFE